MQFLEYGKSKEFFSEESLKQIVSENALDQLITESQVVKDSMSVLSSEIKQVGLKGLYSNQDSSAASSNVVESVYSKIFEILDENQESTRNLVQFVDEYIAYLTDEDIQLDDLKSFVEKNTAQLSNLLNGDQSEIESTEAVNSNESIETVGDTQTNENQVGESSEVLDDFRNGFSCQLEAIEKGLLDQYFSIVNEEICDQLKEQAKEAGTFQELENTILPDLEVISSACNFVELPVSELVFNTLSKEIVDNKNEIENFKTRFIQGLDLVLKVYSELKVSGSECNILSDDTFLIDLHNWTKEGKG